MSGDVNHHTVASFLPAARAQLARCLEQLARCDLDPRGGLPSGDIDVELVALREGAAACGLAPLVEIADIALGIAEDLRTGRAGPDADPVSHLVGICRAVGDFLDACEGSSPDADVLLQELLCAVRDLRTVPPAEPGVRAVPRASERAPSTLQDDPGRSDDVLPPRDIPPELAELFGAEAHDHLQTIARALAGYRDHPQGDQLRDLRRSIHTLKGAAGMVGFRAVSQLAHRVEDLLDQLFERQVVPSPQVVGLLFRSADLLEDLVNGTSSERDLRGALCAIYDEHAIAFEEVRRSIASSAVPPGPATAIPPDGSRSSHQRATPSGSVVADRSLRVPLPRLDELVREVGELAVTRASLEQYVHDLAHQLGELQLSVRRMRRLATRLQTEYEVLALGDSLQRRFGRRDAPATGGPADFDDLELDRYTDFHLISRELTETASDIGAVEQHLGRLRADFDGSLARLVRLTRDLQDDFMALRLVPIATLRTRLERAVRVTAEQRGKLVDLVIEGEEHALDAAVIDQVVEPLLHLLRNAVDHGIEPPGLRRAIGKPERGTVCIRASREAGHLVIVITDDGAGMDNERIRARAVARGFLTETEALEAAGDALRELLFAPGFSTADEVSEVSGRGVGLDVVKSRVEQMKGSISVRSERGAGTSFIVRLPLTLAVTRVLIVAASGGTYAVQLAHVHEVRRVDGASILTEGTRAVLDVGDRLLSIVVLADALGLADSGRAIRDRMTVLDVDVEGRRTGLVVDEVVEARDVVFKPLPSHLSRLPCVAGATLLGTGCVVLILDLADVVRSPAERAGLSLARRQPAPARRPLTVMIVDDSLSVRRVLSGLVAGAGWRPVQARDGMEALEILERLEGAPDVILLDIEMPRLDGFELTEALRGQEAFRAVPIVMITSRGGDKHRQRAFAAGVTEYLVKPFQEEALVSRIAHLARRAPGAAA